ncbi:MAG: HlyD family efflux transporter periplasmic adaptor subunit [Clostridiales bacterium]|nr:HlyD family efflux transporter periplasmic adaptor subunit [Clostridiales bacterium]
MNNKEKLETKKKFKLPKIFKSKKAKIILVIITIILVFNILGKILNPEEKEFNYEEVTAIKGDINVVVTGSGTISPDNQYDITALVQGEILEDYVEEGMLVKKDQLLYVIDSEDVNNSISRAQLNVKNAELTYNTMLNSVQIVASSNGVLTDMNLKVGDMIGQGSIVANVLDNSNVRIVAEFSSQDVKDMYIGQTAMVTVEKGFYQTTGNISKISSSNIISNEGYATSYVEVIVANPGGITDSDSGIVRINNINSNSSSKFEYMNKSVIYSTGSGYIKEIYKLKGDYVKKGEVIARIGGDAIDTQLEQTKIALEDSRINLKNAQDQLDNYKIKSPIDGKVILKNKKKGDILSSSSMSAMSSMSATTSSSAMAIVANMNVINFTIEVDELEISRIQKGQNVIVTCDALNGKEYKGYVENINIVGKSQNGVTNYDVKIIVNDPEGLLPGMNVDAEVQIVSKPNVITVPTSAVRKGNIVYVKTDTNYQDEDTNVPKGYKKVIVEIGENDSDNVEIISGINEGDIVLVDKLVQKNLFEMMGGMNGMGGTTPEE